MLNLLSFWSFLTEERSEDSANVLKTIFIITIVVFALIIIMLAFKTKKFNTKELTLGAMSIALSFVLSVMKIKIGANGGSITFFSMLPIILFAYYFGTIKGLFIGVIYGLLQFIESPYVLNVASFFLDYIFAFASICLAPLFKKIIKNETLSLFIGIVLIFVVRFISHTLSGLFYYPDVAFLDALSASAIYNVLYVFPDMIICLIGAIILSKTKTLNKIFG